MKTSTYPVCVRILFKANEADITFPDRASSRVEDVSSVKTMARNNIYIYIYIYIYISISIYVIYIYV